MQNNVYTLYSKSKVNIANTYTVLLVWPNLCNGPVQLVAWL